MATQKREEKSHAADQGEILCTVVGYILLSYICVVNTAPFPGTGWGPGEQSAIQPPKGRMLLSPLLPDTPEVNAETEVFSPAIQPPKGRMLLSPLLPDTPEVNAETEVFSLEKFVFLWLGIGRKYCE